VRAIIVLVVLGSLLLANSAKAAEACVTDDAYFGGAYKCFMTIEAAEGYLYSTKAGEEATFLDVDASNFERTSFDLTGNASDFVKRIKYRYKEIAPRFDLGIRWTASTASGILGIASTEQEAFDIAVQQLGGDASQYSLQSVAEGDGLMSVPGQSTPTINGHSRAVTRLYNKTRWFCGPSCFAIVDYHEYACPDTHTPRPYATLALACFSLNEGHLRPRNEAIDSGATCKVGNPCHPQTGVKTQDEPDFSWESLTFKRTFSSSREMPINPGFGPGWMPSWDIALTLSSLGELLRIGEKTEMFRYSATTGYSHSIDSPGARIKFVGSQYLVDLADGRTLTLDRLSDYRYRASKIYDRRSGTTYLIDYCLYTDRDASCPGDRVKAIRSSRGRQLGFVYSDIHDGAGAAIGNRLLGIAADGNVLVSYSYDSSGRLATAAYPGTPATTRGYGYNETGRICVNANGTALSPCYVDAKRALLTSVRDENGVGFGVYKYDNFGRVVSSEHPGGADKITLAYASAFSSSVTDALGAVTIYDSVTSPYFYKLTRTETASLTTSNTYDANGYLDLATNKLGVVTDFDFDAAGHLMGVTRAKGTPEQQLETMQWDVTTNQPSVTERAGQRISRAYNSRGQQLTLTVTDLTTTPNVSRTTTNRYCEQPDIDVGTCPLLGALVSVDGPRSNVNDITVYAYYGLDDPQCASSPGNCPYRKGDLWKVTNAAGQVTEYLAYDYAGQPLSIKDANGVITDLEYSSRGRLTARKVRGLDDTGEADDAITRLEYDGVGQVLRLTQPDGVFTDFTYDIAHRLTDITDPLGNKIHFTLDNAGNRLKEETRDGSGSLKRALSRVNNTLGQLQTLKDANLAATGFTYGANGDINTVTDPLGRVTDNDVDPLGRLNQVIANVNRQGVDQATTKFQYDARDNLLAVVDPKGLTTGYSYNGFDELVQLSSPDTTNTAYTYDTAGNPFSQTNARGILTTYNHDALNRLTGISLPTLSQNVRFDFDTPPVDCQSGERYGAGRLAQIQDESGSTRYCYDLRGNLVRKVQGVAGGSTLTVGSTYNGAGRLSAMTYPSGAVVVFLRNANGQVQRIDASPGPGSPQITLVSSVSYLPFGPLTSLTFGNGRSLTKTVDQNYGIDLVSDSVATGLREDFTLNSVGNVTALTERVTATSSVTRALGYDGLDRLISHKQGTKTIVEAFKYDATGNRTAKTVGATTTAYSYPSSNHRLSSVGSTIRTYDAAGNTESIGTGAAARGFEFDDRGRLRDYKLGTTVKASYRYNGQGERVLRLDSSIPANSQQFIFDEAGRLLGEYTTTGVRVKEYVWLDDTLVAILSDHDGSMHQYVETDHLGTPRAVVHPSKNTIVWRWDVTTSMFGEHLPLGDSDANGLGYVLNLRFPGQYSDTESGLSYNYFRDYDPATGRYVESDPIGLGGGTSTYGYVDSSPLRASDPLGLKKWDWDGVGDTSVCKYYDRMAKQTGSCYYENAAKTCRGANPAVNALIDTGIAQAWLFGRTEKSQSQILTDIRRGLIAEDRLSNVLSEAGKVMAPPYGSTIDAYHNRVFKKEGISPVFYGGNLVPRGVWPNYVPSVGNDTESYVGSALSTAFGTTRQNDCSCGGGQ
jgi:RHS repeat-associated protein